MLLHVLKDALNIMSNAPRLLPIGLHIMLVVLHIMPKALRILVKAPRMLKTLLHILNI